MRRTVIAIAVLVALVSACAEIQDEPNDRTDETSVTRAKNAADSRMDPDLSWFTASDRRRFRLTYHGVVKDVPAGTKRLRIWVPVPQDSTVQEIDDVRFSGLDGVRVSREPRYGSEIGYAEIANPPATVELDVSCTVTRKAEKADLARLATDGSAEPGRFGVFLEPDRLVVVDDRIRKIADAVTAGRTSTIEKVRAIYEYVLDHMTYDKTGVGWGRGDTNFACDVGKGNCTDFHSLFNSLCRAEGIASGFEIGLYLPYERGSKHGLGGYHCWAYFRVPGKTWVPVDISEADKHPDRADFFFGGHTSNRVTLSTGRDIVLSPPQAGPPLNYFLNPYAEADGNPVRTDKTWGFDELE